MSRSNTVTNWKEILWSNYPLSQMSLGRKVVLQEVTGLRLLEILQSLFADANLNGVETILFLSLFLTDLASVDLNYGAGHDLTPLVPEVCHANLVPKESDSLAVTVLGCSLL